MSGTDGVGGLPEIAPGVDLAGLDAWLAEREAAHGDVLEHAEARIDWATGVPERTEVALVYLHGFSATRMETHPLSERVAERLGANLLHTRLAGHGRTGAAMGAARLDDWTDDGREALALGRRLGRRVVLVGTSTGGTLATWLAARYPEEVAAVVLLAPNFAPKAAGAFLLLWPGARNWVRWVVGAERAVEPDNPSHERWWITRYPSTALVPMMQLVRAVRQAPLERVRAPVLCLYALEDTVVDSRRTPPTLARMRHAPVETVEVEVEADPEVPNPSSHVIAGDAFAPRMTARLAERIGEFLIRRLDLPAPSADPGEDGPSP